MSNRPPLLLMASKFQEAKRFKHRTAGLFICLLCFSISTFAAPIINLGVDTLRFGSVSLSGNHIRQLQIANDGDRSLIISSANLRLPVFIRLYPSLPDTIAAGHSRNYSIKFDPAAEISYDTVALVHSNDPVTPNARLPLRAYGVKDFQPGDIIWSHQGIGNVVCSMAFPDMNNDGFEDVVADSYSAGAHGDHLLCLSGSGAESTKCIWSARPVGGDSISGGIDDQCLVSTADLNSNGTQDIFFGSAWNSQSVFGIEVSNGQTIWSYNTFVNPPHGYIYSVASLGDINGDGVPEVIAGAGSDANAGYCINGRNGSLIWRAAAGDAVYSVCSIDDVNDDGIADAVIGTGDNSDLIYCLSSIAPDSLRVIWRYNSGGSVLSLTRINDINHDRHNDIIAGISFGVNEVVALSGYSADNASMIWRTPIGAPVMKVVTCPDLNHDGSEDVLVASWTNSALALSGADGSELWRNDMGGDVYSVASTSDITGDSIPEVLAGGLNGEVALIDGATGQTVWMVPTDAPILTVRAIDDINGDGFPDIIAGQEKDGDTGGKILLFSGGTLNPTSISSPEPKMSHDFITLSNYPNPFNAQTRICYYLPSQGMVKLEIFNLLGQSVKTLVDENQNAGSHNVLWDACDDGSASIAAGLYFGRLAAGNQESTCKLIVLK
jgi:outer membrane protein assembly factor BamB